jgi:NADH dehydrogenase/NADH:ubiquinone oxidoreductase subunit G
VHHPDRLTEPVDPQGRGGKDDVAIDPANPLTHFRVASWEEALDRAAEGLKRIRDRAGPQGGGRGALAGFGSAKGSNEEAYLFQKLVRTGFGNNNVDHCTRLCHASSVAALMEGIGSGAVTAPFMAAADAEVIIIIGARPTENHRLPPPSSSRPRSAAPSSTSWIRAASSWRATRQRCCNSIPAAMSRCSTRCCIRSSKKGSTTASMFRLTPRF